MKGQAGHEEAGDGARLESHGKPLRQALAGGLRGPHIRANRHKHADKARAARKDSPDQEPDGNRDREKEDEE